jgi:hypothetical protein
MVTVHHRPRNWRRYHGDAAKREVAVFHDATKYKYPVKVGNQVVEDGSRHHTYTVKRAEGDWLWVVSGSIEGWLPDTPGPAGGS